MNNRRYRLLNPSFSPWLPEGDDQMRVRVRVCVVGASLDLDLDLDLEFYLASLLECLFESFSVE